MQTMNVPEVEEEHVRKILSRIESFILPTNKAVEELPTALAPTNQHVSQGRNGHKLKKDYSSIPLDRLEDTLFQLALADHIRTLQTLYRDNYDDQCLGRELRGVGSLPSSSENGNQSRESEQYEKLPTKVLLDKMIEGRSRALALLRLCFGENSHSMVKGKIELANSYALKGQWEQAEDRIVQALNQLVALEDYEENILFRQRKRISIVAAQRIVTVFQVLRDHVINNHGQVKRSLLEELHAAFSSVMNSDHPDHLQISHPAKLLTSLTDFFNTTKSKHPLKQLSSSYFHDVDQPNFGNQPNNKVEVKTWGDIVYFLRNQCEVMKSYIQHVNFIILPQNKATLSLPFKICDSAERYLAHPGHLSNVLSSFPSVMKLISGSNLCKVLAQLRVVVPLVVNAHTGSVQNLHMVTQSSPSKASVPQQHVGYELPITMEEFLSFYLLECQPMAIDNQFKLLKIQVLTIKGVCSINRSEQSGLAEEVLTQALQQIEELGYENESVACELYNAIAQMMISKYQIYITNKKLRYKEEAENWMLQTEEGKRMVRIQMKVLKKQFNYKAPPMAHAEMEYRAKSLILKNRVKYLLDKKDAENDQMVNNLQAAYRYLVKSYEILDGYHGSFHPITSTACMAIASVQNILKDYESTREWLVKAIRIMEKTSSASSVSIFFPTPIRAITFAQIQLCHVLTKLGYDEEGRRVLYKAAEFQMQLALQLISAFHSSKQLINVEKSPFGDGIRNTNLPVEYFNAHCNPPDTARSHASRASVASDATGNTNTKSKINPREKFNQKKADLAQDQNYAENHLFAGDYNLVLPIIIKNTPLDEEIQLAISLSNEIIEMSIKNGDKWETSNQCERIAHLCEKAYGWDSIESAESYRQVGVHCMDLKDWTRAMRAFHSSAEAHAALYGKTDPRFLAVAKLYAKAKSGKQASANGNELPLEDVPPESPVDLNEAIKMNSPTSPRLSPRSPKSEMQTQSPTADILLSAREEVIHHIHDAHHSTSPRKSHTKSPHIHHGEVMHKSTVDDDEDPYDNTDEFYPPSPQR